MLKFAATGDTNNVDHQALPLYHRGRGGDTMAGDGEPSMTSATPIHPVTSAATRRGAPVSMLHVLAGKENGGKSSSIRALPHRGSTPTSMFASLTPISAY
jgi:hypothetical protein